jgi:glycosyltransferase involved in cell wall biosynthesis
LAKVGREIVERELSFRHYVFDLLKIAGLVVPRVSVVVPNYNYAQYLPQRLRDVACQTLPLYELIILDDCSSDDSVGVIRSFASKCEVPAILGVNNANSGCVFKQWLKGVELARGEYVWIAEADDRTRPQFLARIVSRMSETGAAIGFCDSWQVDAEGVIVGSSYKRYMNGVSGEDFNGSFVLEGNEFLKRFLSVRNVVLNVSGVVFRRDALLDAMRNVGEELFTYRVAGDWRIYVELCLACSRVVYEPATLNGHRRHGASVTHALHAARHLQEIRQIHELCRRYIGDQELTEAQDKYLEEVEVTLTGRMA